eukprot:15352080-Ditylum_brightwellii.AAC.1
MDIFLSIVRFPSIKARDKAQLLHRNNDPTFQSQYYDARIIHQTIFHIHRGVVTGSGVVGRMVGDAAMGAGCSAARSAGAVGGRRGAFSGTLGLFRFLTSLGAAGA